jgi:hypothetical protein
MSESDEWWRAHLDEGEGVIWHGGIQKDGMAQPFKSGFWVTLISGVGGLVFGPIMLLTGSDDAWKMLILGTAFVALSFVFKKANRLGGVCI